MRPGARLRQRLQLVRVFGIDGLFVVAAVVGIYYLFLRTWSLWDDPGIYQYMAWGVRHGLKVYKDTINMNWPGTIFVHLAAQWLTGMDPRGVRIMECLFLAILGLATSATLREYGVPAPFRVAAFTVFLVSYFMAGFPATAQRESFMTPCLAVGLFPLFTTDDGAERRGALRWILGGAFAAFGFLVKPTIAVPVAGALVTTLIFWRGRPYRTLWKRLGLYCGSGLGVLLAAVVFLAVYGDFRGFWRWGVQMAFGPYARLKYEPELLKKSYMTVLNEDYMTPTWKLCALGVCAFAVLNLVLTAGFAIHSPRARAAARVAAARVFNHLFLVVLVAWTVYTQGKTHCIYHFVPLKWALAVLGAVLCGQAFSGAPAAWLQRRASVRHALAAASFIAGIGYWSAWAADVIKAPKEDPLSDPWKTDLAKALGPDETVIVFGYSSPTAYCVVQRPSPLPFVDSWIMYATTQKGSKLRREYVAIWDRAMTSPNLRFFLVQRGAKMSPDLRFPDGDDALSEAAVAEHFPPEKLAELGFAPSKTLSIGGFDVYERATTASR